MKSDARLLLELVRRFGIVPVRQGRIKLVVRRRSERPNVGTYPGNCSWAATTASLITPAAEQLSGVGSSGISLLFGCAASQVKRFKLRRVCQIISFGKLFTDQSDL